MKSRILILFNQIFALGLLLLLAGCGGGGSSSTTTRTGTISAKVVTSDAPQSIAEKSATTATKSVITQPGVTTVKLSVSGPGMNTISKTFPVSDGKGVVDGIPVGVDRQLNVQGLDATGVILSAGEVKNITVQQGQTSDVGTVSLTPTGSSTISGTVTMDGSGLAGVTVFVGAYMATTIADGSYSINGVPNGSYNLTATKSGYNFSPTSIQIKVNNANITGQNFTGILSSYSISGTVTINGSGLAGVTIATNGGSATTLSDGSYTISGLLSGSYTLTASKNGYSFSPASITVPLNNANVTGQNFNGTLIPTSFNITGIVTFNGSGLAGVSVTAGSFAATTLSDGSYSITGVPNGSYTLSASKSGYSFSPSSIPITVSNANITGQNFTGAATPTTITVTGYVKDQSTLQGVSGVVVNFTSAGVVKSATTASDGSFSVSLLSGEYTYATVKSGYSPISSSVTFASSPANQAPLVVNPILITNQVTSTSLVGNWYVTEASATSWSMTCNFLQGGTGTCSEMGYPWNAVWNFNQDTRFFTMGPSTGGGGMYGTISGTADNFYVDGHWYSGSPGYFHWIRQ
jgi:hypothetical protein